MKRESPWPACLIGSETGRVAARAALRAAGFAVRERPALSEIDEDAPCLACVVLEHPDQYPPGEVRRFLAGWSGARIVCVRLPWCASLLRTRSDWPAATVVDLSELPQRLSQEADRLQGCLAPLPLTAGLEEIAAGRLAAPNQPISGGHVARVVSADRVYCETLQQQLADAGVEVADSSSTPDLLILDADSMSEDSLREHRRSASATTRVVLLAAAPGQQPDPPPAGLVVVSKFQSPGDWLRRLLFALCLMPAATWAGCSPKEAPRPETQVRLEKSWDEQIEAVRRGSATAIVVSNPVTAAEWEALATGCESLEVLEAENARLSDEDFQRLDHLPQLRRLRIGPSFSDAAAAIVGRHPALSEIVVSSELLTDAGVALLCQRPLTQLRLRAPQVTDSAMTSIGGLDRLRFLHLIDVPMTDAGLAPLAGIVSLESLYLDRAKCTDEGLSALLKQRPDIHFHRDQMHLRDDPRRHPH